MVFLFSFCVSSAQKLVDAWYGKGAGSLRVKSVPVPKFSREMGEALLAHLLVSGYLQEDFHFTPYSTISYLKRGRNTRISCLYFSVSVLEMREVDTYFGVYTILQIIFCNVFEMKILLGDFNAKVGRENSFKPTIGNESLHQDSNDNGVRIVNFATSKNLVVKSTMFPHRDIHKHTWTSPDGKTHNQIDHILIDWRRQSSILDVRSFRGADCDTDHCLVVAEVRERLAVSKQAA